MLVARRTQAERSAATQGRLLDAALDCLVELGYAGTMTTVVAKRAGVSRGAQLHHFPTRAALVAAAVEHLYALFTAARSDVELRAHLAPIAVRHQHNVHRLAREYFPEAARLDGRFDATLALLLDAMQGMASSDVQRGPVGVAERLDFLHDIAAAALVPAARSAEPR